ncbi:thioredoxin family protein [Sphingomonas sp. G124]|uniref:Thioredoxin family protein n=1 Tax=Sphingomonas cremea TaxID=2904799 RepID=A0A9X1QP30_9SPHN|nr:protein-disulfide reductase DsbD domain-containing protein [Sphingomonas cremea]MCF2515597.1 thioredoxin family protein [Sphingomonas cremea]
MIRWLPLFVFALLAQPAVAQIASRQNAIRPELIAEGPATPGGEVELAILMHTDPGWHGYWLNPGDAGLPMKIEWQLPKGARLGPLRFPVPDKLLVAGIVNYVYERDYALLTRFTVPANARGVVPIRAEAQWLACTDKICVPERGSISLNVPTAMGEATERVRFDEWRRALPRPLASPARFAVRDNKIEIAVPLPASVMVGQPYFFPADDGPIDYAAPQGFRRKGDLLIAELERRRGNPERLSGVLALGDGRGLEIKAIPGQVPKGGQSVGGLGANALFYALFGAMVGGLLLNLMPCVFPILALKALHLAKLGGDESRARRDALAYTAGAIIGTGLLGAALLAIRAGGSAAGWAFQLQDPRTTIVLLLLTTAITLNLLRAFELPVLAGEHNPQGSFGTGALAAFVATPCAGPFLGAALGTALLLPIYGSIAVFAALGLGLAIPFLLIAFIPILRGRLPRPGPWMVRLQRFLAIPMAATAVGCLWLLYRQGGPAALLVGLGVAGALTLLLYLTGLRQRRGQRTGWAAFGVALLLTGVAATQVPRQPQAAARVPLGSEAWSETAVEKYRAAGKPVFVYFTADWCLTCKANEAAAIERQATREAFGKAGIRVFVGDWTNGDPAITRFLEGRGRAGVPLYLWYEPGRAEPEELPQILTPGMLIERALRPR